MKEKSCRCGLSKKRFKMDIGPFFVDDCCLKNGFDELGRPITSEPAPLEKEPIPTVSEPIPTLAFPIPTVQEPIPTTELRIPGKGKMKDMRVEELKALAKSVGVENSDSMTKNQLIDALASRR